MHVLFTLYTPAIWVQKFNAKWYIERKNFLMRFFKTHVNLGDTRNLLFILIVQRAMKNVNKDEMMFCRPPSKYSFTELNRPIIVTAFFRYVRLWTFFWELFSRIAMSVTIPTILIFQLSIRIRNGFFDHHTNIRIGML